MEQKENRDAFGQPIANTPTNTAKAQRESIVCALKSFAKEVGWDASKVHMRWQGLSFQTHLREQGYAVLPLHGAPGSEAEAVLRVEVADLRKRLEIVSDDNCAQARQVADLLAENERLRATPPTPTAPEAAGEAGERERQIRERLAAATPWPWVFGGYEYDDWGFVRAPDFEGRGLGLPVAKAFSGKWQVDLDAHRAAETDPTAHNADLIANAPADLAYLLEKLEASRAALESTYQLAAGLQQQLAEAGAGAGQRPAVRLVTTMRYPAQTPTTDAAAEPREGRGS